MKISRETSWAEHISEFWASLMLGSLMAWSYYMQPLPWLIVGVFTMMLLKTSMEVRRLAKYQGTPLIPLNKEETDDTKTT